ncbi:hypothetical protein GCM10009768_08370 [Leucobacter iarius]|uniref:Uncharacterized protein n=1 Tax=Leucobacter iarius TaxID=333963 RepID=A0ABN2LAT0_9MICO
MIVGEAAAVVPLIQACSYDASVGNLDGFIAFEDQTRCRRIDEIIDEVFEALGPCRGWNLMRCDVHLSRDVEGCHLGQ